MRKALVVSDEISLAEVTKRHIDALGFNDLEVLTSFTSDDAVDKLSDGDVSFVVLDDGIRGVEAVAKTASGLNSKILLVTNDNKGTLDRYDPVAYLKKPSYFSELRSEVSRLYPTFK